MEYDSEQEIPGLKAARIVTLLLLCAVAITASYVESRYPISQQVSSPTKP